MPSRRARHPHLLPLCALGALLCAAGEAPPVSAPAPGASAALNDGLERVAAERRAARARPPAYRVGPGDVLEIDVFDVDELDRTARVQPEGTLTLPLVGALPVAGLTTREVERRLEARLGRDYLQSPQVSVFVKEYRAHPVSVLGEVNEPGVYYLREPRTLVEMLSEAGGLTEDAAWVIRLRRRTETPDGRRILRLKAVDLEEQMLSADDGPELELVDDDTIFVPRAGVVYVEGAVNQPGVYKLRGTTTVLEAVAMAGGLRFEARRSALRLLRKGRDGEAVMVDVDAARRSRGHDVALRDGDVVVVQNSPVRLALSGFWRGLTGLVRVSTAF